MTSTRHVALFRGINVGGKNKVAMKPLTALFVEAGCRDVASYIQSGNVVFSADLDLATTLPGTIAARVLAEFGVKTALILRSTAEMAATIASNPMIAAGCAEDTLHVLFMADQPTTDRVATLDPDRSLPDRFEVIGREVYLHLPNGAADTKLTVAYFDARLATTTTGRNWRTVGKLLAMLEA